MKTPLLVTDNPVKITTLVPGGQGLGTTEEGIKGFFWNALPDETVAEYEITKKKSHYFEAIATRIENPSSHRRAPLDSCYLSTSPWQIMDYGYELAQKGELLAELFRQQKIDTSGHQFSVATDNQDFHYRNKMEYSLWYDKVTEKISLAFHRRGSHRKFPIETSSIERPEIFAKAQEIVADLNSRGDEARRYQSLLLRCNQNGDVSGGLFENHQPHPVFAPLTDTLLGETYIYSPNGFFQINLPVYELALQEIRKHITTDHVLDLYAGVGTIGLSVARDRELTLVEVDKSAFAELEKNCIFDMGDARERSHTEERGSAPKIWEGPARQDPSSKIQFFLARAEGVTDFLRPDQTVIVDPPRAGLDQKLVAKLLEIQPTTIIYLSCNPATQTRDLAALLEKYNLDLVQPYNFFPRTPHLENLVILSHK